MISLLKNTVLRRSLLFKPALCFGESVSQYIERNKAILASQIIQTIMESPLNQYQSDRPCRSLKETILDKIEAYKIDVVDGTKQQEITQKTREGLRKYFVSGVWVPHDMCSQNRFKENLQQYQQIINVGEEVEANLDELSPEEISQMKFAKLQFCPTYFVTGQVFRSIYSSSRFLLLTGQYGVGKTYSFILYTLLSEIIFRYRHKYCSNKKMMDLPKEFDPQIPKALYWNVKIDSETYTPMFINQLIRRQFYEMKKTGFNVDGHILKPAEVVNMPRLLKLNQPIKTVLLMDQISELAAALRDYELASKNLKEFSSKKESFQKRKNEPQFSRIDIKQLEQEEQKIITAMDKASEKRQNYLSYNKILQHIIGKQIFDKIIYLSSVDIEKNYLGQLQLMGWSKQAKIEDNSYRIYYPSTLYGDISISDSVEFCIFLLKKQQTEQLRRDLNKDEQTLLNKIKSALFKIIKKYPLTFFIPYRMYKTIQLFTKYRLEQFSKKQNIKEFNAEVYLLIQDIQKYSINDMKEKLQDFISKKLPNYQLEKIKPIILLQFWAQSLKIVENAQLSQKKNENYQQNKAKQIWRSLPLLQVGLTQVNITEDMAPAIPNKLFGFKQGKLVSFVSPVVFCKVMKLQKIKLFQMLLISQQRFFKHIKKGSALGNFIQSVFIDILSKGNTNLKFTVKQKQAPQCISMQNINPTIGCFIPIPQKDHDSYNEFQFIQSFASYFEQLLKTPNNQRALQWNLLLPVKNKLVENLPQIAEKGIKDDQVDQFSKLIDFTLCKLQYQENRWFLRINAFDVTVGKTSHKNKIKRFLEEFSNFKDKYQKKILINNKQTEVIVNYMVLTAIKYEDFNCKQYINSLISSKKRQAQKQLTIPTKKITILEQFQFEDCGHTCKVSNKIPKKKLRAKTKHDLNSNNEKCILRYIGVISMFNDAQVENPVHDLNLDIRMIKRFEEQAKQNPHLLQNEQ